jgi:hypothetical protein
VSSPSRHVPDTGRGFAAGQRQASADTSFTLSPGRWAERRRGKTQPPKKPALPMKYSTASRRSRNRRIDYPRHVSAYRDRPGLQSNCAGLSLFGNYATLTAPLGRARNTRYRNGEARDVHQKLKATPRRFWPYSGA